MSYIEFNIAPLKDCESFFNCFEDTALAVTSYEFASSKDTLTVDEWGIKLLFDTTVDIDEVYARILEIAYDMTPLPLVKINKIEDKDWVSHVYKNSPPLEIGGFYIYGTHDKDKPLPLDKICLLVNAATAFGSGEHETTSSCLLAIEELCAKQEFSKIIDLGCGSGILSLGLAKITKNIITAVDCDPESITVTQDNAKLNQCQDFINAYVSTGFEKVPQEKFDLLVANILAKPLMIMAEDFNKCCAQGGYIILSGLLTRQRSDILSAYEPFANLVHVYTKNGWDALVLQKR